MSEQEPQPKTKEQVVYDLVQQLHDEFFHKVPGYEPSAWNPKRVIEEKTETRKGSCMAELLYVAGGLIAKNILTENDIAIGFSAKHGTEEMAGVFGKKQRKAAHTSAFFTVDIGRTIAVDFRAHRAGDKPQFDGNPDLSDGDDYYIGTFQAAINEYATKLGDEPLSVDDLVSLHRQNTTEVSESEVSFDEDF